jgi:AcrR family transcriptional regulator
MAINSAKSAATSVEGGRKSAYVARNRAKIILAAQEVMAQLGTASTVEAVSERAQIASSTIYKHFETRNDLFEAALISAFQDWEAWALAQLPKGATDLELAFLPARLLLRIPETHPIYAKLIGSFSGVGLNVSMVVVNKMNALVWKLVSDGVLKIDDVDIRLRNLQGAILQTLEHRIGNPDVSNSDVDKSLEIALSMIGVSPSQAKKLCSAPL